MSKKFELKSVAATVGTVLAASAIAMPSASAAENPFQMNELASGYMVAEKEGMCGEGKCGEGKCGMNKRGPCCGMKKMDADKDGAVSREEFMKHHEMKFTQKDKNKDGQLTADEMKKKKKGKCGGMKMKEGKCGEGKCGEKKSDS